MVSIGVFDGVHRGHQEILARNLACAREKKAEPTVVTFRRHPKRVLLGRAPHSITTLDHRLVQFRRAGIGHVLVLRFTDELRSMEAERFTEDILVRGLDARAFVLGFDNKFGRNARGGPDLLRQHGHPVEVVEQVVVGHRPVSSTAIREAIGLGDLDGAAAMLGRPVSILGRVVHGDHLGRQLGIPTANLDLMGEHHPPRGVYAARARHVSGEEDRGRGPSHPAMANIGLRPTVTSGDPELRIEVHLLDYSGDLYGERLEVEFVRRFREERSFPDLSALRAQLEEDAATARAILEAPTANG